MNNFLMNYWNLNLRFITFHSFHKKALYQLTLFCLSAFLGPALPEHGFVLLFCLLCQMVFPQCKLTCPSSFLSSKTAAIS